MIDSAEMTYFRNYIDGIRVEFDSHDQESSEENEGCEEEGDSTIFDDMNHRKQSTPKESKQVLSFSDCDSDSEIHFSVPSEKAAVSKSTDVNREAGNVNKRKKLYDPKRNLLSDTLANETSGRQEKVCQQAKKDYVENPVPSTSKANMPATKFKVPKSPLKTGKSQKRSNGARENSSSESDDNISSVSTQSRRDYVPKEEQEIINWIIKNRQFSAVGGIAMWKLLEASGEVPGRTYQSMKERFRKKILPKIEFFDIDEDHKKAFKKVRALKQKKNKLKFKFNSKK